MRANGRGMVRGYESLLLCKANMRVIAILFYNKVHRWLFLWSFTADRVSTLSAEILKLFSFRQHKKQFLSDGNRFFAFYTKERWGLQLLKLLGRFGLLGSFVVSRFFKFFHKVFHCSSRIGLGGYHILYFRLRNSDLFFLDICIFSLRSLRLCGVILTSGSWVLFFHLNPGILLPSFIPYIYHQATTFCRTKQDQSVWL